MEIYVEPIADDDLKPLFDDPAQLGFGSIFTDRMFTVKYSKEAGWHDAKITKYQSFTFDPASCVLHYSQEIFEGLKAYAGENGQALLFRPEENARRMNRSAKRLCMPELPVEYFIQALKELIMLEKRWIPRSPGTSLYIRPTMIATQPFLGVHPADEYIFYIILSPVGPYFKTGFKPVGIYVEDKLVRSVVGGVGDIKTGGNYAASLMGARKAEEKGFSQVLWLDAKEHKYVEEVGAMNMFFVIDNKLVTPKLTGSILPGITRDSVLKLAAGMGYQVEERLITVDEVIEGIASGAVTEAFGSGTAAVISPVGALYYQDKNYIVNNNEVGPVTKALYNRLVNIQYGREKDEYGWVMELGKL